jgi:hypothetical protein
LAAVLRGSHDTIFFDEETGGGDNGVMTKLSIVLLLVGIVLYFTGKQAIVSVVLMALGGLGLIVGIYLSNRR